MKPRHLQMIAVGGSIGTGLFVGSGNALSIGGPAGILIAWIIIGEHLDVTKRLGRTTDVAVVLLPTVQTTLVFLFLLPDRSRCLEMLPTSV